MRSLLIVALSTGVLAGCAGVSASQGNPSTAEDRPRPKRLELIFPSGTPDDAIRALNTALSIRGFPLVDRMTESGTSPVYVFDGIRLTSGARGAAAYIGERFFARAEPASAGSVRLEVLAYPTVYGWQPCGSEPMWGPSCATPFMLGVSGVGRAGETALHGVDVELALTAHAVSAPPLVPAPVGSPAPLEQSASPEQSKR